MQLFKYYCKYSSYTKIVSNLSRKCSIKICKIYRFLLLKFMIVCSPKFLTMGSSSFINACRKFPGSTQKKFPWRFCFAMVFTSSNESRSMRDKFQNNILRDSCSLDENFISNHQVHKPLLLNSRLEILPVYRQQQV